MSTRDSAHWSALDYVVIDTEGTGKKHPDLVELAVVRIEDGEIGEPFAWQVRPDTPISPYARKIHGITDAQVRFRPRFDGIADAVRRELYGATPVGHNVRVDLGLMARKLPRWCPEEAFCTLRMARSTLDTPDRRLSVLAERLGLTEDMPGNLHPHRAAWDALVTARLFVYLANESGPRAWTVAELRSRGRWLCPRPEAQLELMA